MRSKYCFLILFGCVIYSTQAQKFKITGKLIDAQNESPLEAATVVVETVKDSSMITYTITDKSGAFNLEGKAYQDTVNFYVTFVGYAPYSKKINLKESTAISLGDIPLGFAVEALGDVVVKARAAPVTIKKDTLEFNVASFKTKKDANVEDLLRELPGVEVDEQGQITINGKPVNKILVNGKPFFSDPTMATRNLTKEIVDKIQIVDTKTESEEFTGEEGDDQNKTINITIDKEKNKGIFGRVAGGLGTDERFEYAGILNYFDNNRRLSVLGNGNNINSPGFSFGEIESMFGSARYISVSDNGSFNINGRSFGGGDGINNSRTAGANYVDVIGKDNDVSADYFYTGSNNFQEEKRSRETTLPERSFFSNSSSRSVGNNDSHALNTRFEIRVDSTFLIEARPEFTYTEGMNNFTSNQSTRNADGELTNQADVNNASYRNGRNFENRLTFTKRYGGKGGFAQLEVQNNINNTATNAYLESNTQIFDDTLTVIERNQFTDGTLATNGIGFNAEWRIPLIAKKLFARAQYRYNTDKREDRQSVFDFEDANNQYTGFNIAQSTDFTNTDRSSRPELGLNFNSDKMRLSFSAAYIFRTLESDDALRDINFSNEFNALELDGRFNINFSKKTSLYSGYSLNNNAPGVRQLSPYIDVSDPLNTVQGNPNLRPTNSHSIYFGISNFDWQSRTGFNSYFNANFDNDRVVNRSTIDENNVRNTTYANVDGYYNLYGRASYSKNIEIDTSRTLKYDLSIGINTSRVVNFNNGVQYASRTIAYEPQVELRFTWKEILDIRPAYTPSFSRNSFDLDIFKDRDFTRHEFRLRTTTSYPKRVEWENDIRFINNPNVASGFQTNSVFWNSSLAYSVLDDKGTVALKAYDLLNQNTNAQRTATEDYIQDIQSTVLQRYFMLSFSYKFNTLGKQGEIRENNWFD
ncbi:outer membrane beta-barrel protein [Flavimarina sp. Hel_I_48]|uniref:outer membrane beta-barrel protein n=1 Tax=Flavimarina sp. Hel_I_48 TaxID=1392488 RepID=UPI0004DFC43F|nr:outer membrane beta-barrel protein [Flavimarina sp. Hel_I_48]